MAADDDSFLSRWSRRKAATRQGGLPAEGARTPALDAGRTPTTALDAGRTPTTAPDAHRAPRTPVPAADAGMAPAHADARSAARPAEVPPAPPAPTLAEAELLTPDADFTRFVARDVDPGVRNAALKRLFLDPHFNVMDGLDIYIDDYGIPDPLPPGMLERMAQSEALGLFRKDVAAPASAARGATDDVAANDAEACAESDTDTATDSATVAPDAGDAGATDPHALAALPPPTDTVPDEDTDLRLQPHHDAGCAGPEAGPGQDAGRTG